MKKKYVAVVVCYCFLLFASCKKDPSVATDPAPPPVPVTPDSIFVLNSLQTWDGSITNFTYDTVAKRYNNFSFHYNSYNWDSTFISYGTNNRIVNMVNKIPEVTYGYSVTPTVLVYNNASQLSKIYKKRKLYAYQNPTAAYYTDVSNPNTISYYDSLNYDNKNRISSSYRVYYDLNGQPYFVTMYRKFYYQTANDSLLTKIELFDRDGSNNFRLYETLGLNGYDQKNNPFFANFSLYGLLTPYVTRFNIQPNTKSSYLTDFLSFTPQSCNKLSIENPSGNYLFSTNVNYTYNAAGLPTRVYYGDPGEYVLFFYKKQKK